MNVGSSRGSGGDGLSGHWLKAKNEEVRALEPRGIGARGDLKAQVRALTAETAHATFAKPVAHFWFPPNPADRKPTAEEKADLLARIEAEFHLEHQPRIGCAHVLRRDMEAAGKERHPSWEGADEHEHYAWSLVRENGQAVDHMRKSMIRQQRVVAEWQHAHGFQITPMKHATPVLEYLDRHNPEVAAAVRAAGMRSLNDPDPSAATIALYRTQERAQLERSPTVPGAAKTRHAFNVRRDVLGAWRASDDGRAFEAALAERGYRLAQGARSAMIVDPAGIEHRATEVLGTAGRKLEGKAVAAAEVHVRLAGLNLPPIEQARQAIRDRGSEAPAAGVDDIPQEDLEAVPACPAGPTEDAEVASPAPMEPSPAPEPVPSVEPVTETAPAEPTAPSTGADTDHDVPSQGGGPVIGGGGNGGGGPAPADDDFVAPLDPTRPGDLARYLRQFAAAEKKKANLLIRENRGSGDAMKKAAEAAEALRERLNEFFENAAEERARRLERETEHVGSERNAAAQPGSCGSDTGRDASPGRGAEASEQLRPQGSDSRDLRGALDSEGHARPARPEATVGSAPGGRAEQDGPGDRAPGADRRKPGPGRGSTGEDGASSPAGRVRARREAKGFAETAGRHTDRLRSLSARLASTPERIAGQERLARIKDALFASRERIARVLAGAPYPDSASRDPDVLAEEERARVQEWLKEAQAKAETARAAAAEARGRLGILGRLGLPTADRREVDALEQAARNAEDNAEEAEHRLPEELREADRRARMRAGFREDEQGRWECSREVSEARREEHGNDLVREAIRNGGQEVERAAAKDLDGAREELLRREEEQRQQEERERREQELQEQREREVAEESEPELEHVGARGSGRGAPTPAPGPRIR